MSLRNQTKVNFMRDSNAINIKMKAWISSTLSNEYALKKIIIELNNSNGVNSAGLKLYNDTSVEVIGTLQHYQTHSHSLSFSLPFSLSSLAKPSAANVLWNVKNLICRHVYIISSITVHSITEARALGTGVRHGRLPHSDGETGLWLGPHTDWNDLRQLRNQIINSDTRHHNSSSWLAWKFWYGSISNLSPSCQI